MIRLIAVLMLAASPAAGAVRTPSPSGWVSKITTSPMDDSKTISIGAEASAPVNAWPGVKASPVLVVKCSKGAVQVVTALGFAPAVEPGSPYTASVLVRFDKDFPSGWILDKTTDAKVLLFQDPDNLVALLLAHEVMTFQVTPFNTSPQVTSFALRGLRAAMAPCGWVPKAPAE